MELGSYKQLIGIQICLQNIEIAPHHVIRFGIIVPHLSVFLGSSSCNDMGSREVKCRYLYVHFTQICLQCSFPQAYMSQQLLMVWRHSTLNLDCIEKESQVSFQFYLDSTTFLLCKSQRTQNQCSQVSLSQGLLAVFWQQ